MKEEFGEKGKIFPSAILELENIIKELEDILEHPEWWGTTTREIFYVALSELSSVWGILNRGRSFDSRQLDAILDNVQNCLYEIDKDDSLPERISQFSMHARLSISRAKREIYKLEASLNPAASDNLQHAHS